MTLARTPSTMLCTRSLLGLLGDREQGFLQRQSRLHQRRQLPGEQRQIRGRNAPRQGKTALLRLLLLGDRVDGDREQLPLAQQLAHMAGRIALRGCRGSRARR